MATKSKATTNASAKKPHAKPQKAPQERVYRKTPGHFERVSPERFVGAEEQILSLLGRNLREARKRAGYTQADVADIIHSSQPFVGAIERGEHNIRLTTLVRLAYAVRTDPGALLLGERANSYSLETLVRLVGALYAHLEAEVADNSKAFPKGEILTLISSSPFRFNVDEREGGDRPVVKPRGRR